MGGGVLTHTHTRLLRFYLCCSLNSILSRFCSAHARISLLTHFRRAFCFGLLASPCNSRLTDSTKKIGGFFFFWGGGSGAAGKRTPMCFSPWGARRPPQRHSPPPPRRRAIAARQPPLTRESQHIHANLNKFKTQTPLCAALLLSHAAQSSRNTHRHRSRLNRSDTPHREAPQRTERTQSSLGCDRVLVEACCVCTARCSTRESMANAGVSPGAFLRPRRLLVRVGLQHKQETHALTF